VCIVGEKRFAGCDMSCGQLRVLLRLAVGSKERMLVQGQLLCSSAKFLKPA